MSDTLVFRDPHGGVFEVDDTPQEVAKAAALRWTPATKGDVAAALEREKAASIGGIAKTAAESTAAGAYDALSAIPRVATALGAAAVGAEDPLAGLSGRSVLEGGRYALGRLGGESNHEAVVASDEYAAAQRARAEVNPGTAMSGSIAGQIGGALATGGLGEIAEGAGAATSKGATALLGKSAGARVASRLAGAGVRGAVEGGALGATGAEDQAYIEDRQLTGEQILAAGGLNALLGGGLSMTASGLSQAFGGARRAIASRFAPEAGGATEASATAATDAKPTALSKELEKAGPKDVERLAEREFGEAAPGLGDAWAKASAAASGSDADTIRSLTRGPFTKEGAALRRVAVFEGDALREQATRDLTNHVDQMASATKNLTEEWRGPAKVENVENVIAKGDEAFGQQFTQAVDQTTAVSKRVNEMLADPLAYGRTGPLRELRRITDLSAREVAQAAEAESGARMFTALDNMKKRMGPLLKAGREVSVSSADSYTTQAVREMYESLRTGLEDHATWGGAATMQKDANSAFTRWLGTKNLFDDRFVTKVGRDVANPLVDAYAADAGKVGAYVNGLTSTKNDIAHRIVTEHIEATKQLAGALAKAGELTTEKAAELKRVTDAASGFGKTIGEAEKSLVLSNQLKALQNTTSSGLGSFAAGGAVLGGPLGALGGAALHALANPATVVRQMAALERLADSAKGKFSGALDGFFKPMMAGAGRVGEGLRATGAAASVAAIPTALAAFQGKHATPEKAYQARVEGLMAAADNNGGAVRNAAVKSFGGLMQSEPHVTNSAVVAATNGINYLLSKVPTGTVDPTSLTPSASRPTPSRADIYEFATVYQAVDKPLSVLRDLHNGTITSTQVDAIHAVYPRLYDWMRGEAMGRLREMDQAGLEVPIRERQVLDTLFDLNGAGEWTFTPEFAAKYADGMGDAAAQKNQRPQPRPSPGPSKVASRLQTGTSAMLGGGMS